MVELLCMILNGIIASDEDGVVAPDHLLGPALIGETFERFDKNVLLGKVLLYRSVVGVERELEIVAIPEVVDLGEFFEESRGVLRPEDDAVNILRS